jgi:hypothetical protein
VRHPIELRGDLGFEREAGPQVGVVRAEHGHQGRDAARIVEPPQGVHGLDLGLAVAAAELPKAFVQYRHGPSLGHPELLARK